MQSLLSPSAIQPSFRLKISSFIFAYFGPEKQKSYVSIDSGGHCIQYILHWYPDTVKYSEQYLMSLKYAQ